MLSSQTSCPPHSGQKNVNQSTSRPHTSHGRATGCTIRKEPACMATPRCTSTSLSKNSDPAK